MARQQYTYTPGYMGSGRQASQRNSRSKGMASGYYGVAQPHRTQTMQAEKTQRSLGETLVLTLLFIVLPLCGVLSLFVPSVLWLFILVAIAALTGMLAIRCFAPRARMIISGTLVVFMTASVIALINPSKGGGSAYPPAGEYDQTYYAQQPDTGATPPIGGAETEAPAGIVSTPEPTTVSSMLVSDGEMVMHSYLQMWRDENYEGMVQYTWPTWRQDREAPQRQLYYNHSGWKLSQWDITPEPSSPTADSLTLTVYTTLMKDGNTTALYECTYKAMLFRVGETWYVDPNSMQGSPSLVDANKSPAPVATDEAGQPVAANPTTKPTTQLWYNPDGGAKYHLEQKCSEINSKYYAQMKSFEYSQLDEHAKLQPCQTCNAPR